MKSLSFLFAIVCSIVSQIFIALNINGGGALKMMWLVPFCCLLLSNPKDFFYSKILNYYLFAFVFALYCLICEVFTGVQYIGADSTNIFISVFILSVSFSYGRQSADLEKTLKHIAVVCFAASFIYGIVVYRHFLSGADMFSTIYAYDAKNSAAQILLSSCIILFTLYKPQKYVTKIVEYLSLTVLLLIMILLKSRATLLGFLYVLFFFSFSYKNKKVRRLFILLGVVALLFIFSNPSIYNTVVNGILFANRDVRDMNQLTSGRVDLMQDSISLFLSSPLIGVGNKYFDCFPVIILTQYGILGGLLVFAFVGKRIKECLVVLDKTNKLELSAYLLMITYLLDSLFEAQPPFGPGVKCFPLWMIWGIMLSRRSLSDRSIST